MMLLLLASPLCASYAGHLSGLNLGFLFPLWG